VKPNVNTGTKTNYSGFSVDEIYIVDINDARLSIIAKYSYLIKTVMLKLLQG